MEAEISIVIQEILSSKSLKLISQNIKPLGLNDETFFMAGIFQITLEVEDGTLKKVLNLLAKSTKYESKRVIRGPYRLERLFVNEVMFYEKYVKIAEPWLKGLIPEYYYGSISEKENMWIVVEFLEDYNMCEYSITIPNDHVELVCKELGRFHGIGYISKANAEENLMEFRSKLMETRFGNGVLNDEYAEKFFIHLKLCAERGFNYLPDKHIYPEQVIEKYYAKFQDWDTMYSELFKPKSDLAVLCHGDFNRNNIMFKYSKSGELLSLKLIDFQTVTYGQPGIDLATLFSWNVQQDMLQHNFEKYLHIYYSSLIDTIKSSPSIDVNKFSYDRIIEDYAKHAWLGYIIRAYFLPILQSPKIPHMQNFLELTPSPENLQEFVNQFGFDETWKHTGMYLKHCIDINEKYVRDV